MKFIDYSPLALRTAKPLPHEQQVLHALLGLVTEVGELADCIKRHVIYSKPLDKVNLMEEVLDSFWYLNLYMYEMKLGGGIVDELTPDRPAADWELVRGALYLNSLVGTLNVPDIERGVPASEVVAAIAGLLLNTLNASGFTLSDALTRNIDKLALRYGDKYSDYNALNRDTTAERALLEGVPGG